MAVVDAIRHGDPECAAAALCSLAAAGRQLQRCVSAADRTWSALSAICYPAEAPSRRMLCSKLAQWRAYARQTTQPTIQQMATFVPGPRLRTRITSTSTSVGPLRSHSSCRKWPA